MEIKGDLNVGRLIEVGRRINEGAVTETATSLNLDLYAHKLQVFNVATAGNVILPDATTLPNGWGVIAAVLEESAAVTVRTYNGLSPESAVTLKQVVSGRAYEFILLDNSTEAGIWMVNYLEEADLTPSERFVASFEVGVSAGNWASGSGYVTVTVTESVHSRGAYPMVQVFKDSSTDKIVVWPDQILVNAAGDVVIRVPTIGVPNDPGLRFAGKIVIV